MLHAANTPAHLVRTGNFTGVPFAKRHKKQTGREGERASERASERERESGGAIESLMGEGREGGRKETDKGSRGKEIRERGREGRAASKTS